MSDKLPCCGNDKVILVDISRDDFRQIQCSSCGAKFWQDKKTGELSLKNFGPKRPWTPGPWFIAGMSVYALRPIGYGAKKINTMYAQFQHCRGGADDSENEWNAKICSKAPEMAELLIKLREQILRSWEIDDFYGIEFERLYDDIEKLLKEIGYETPS